MKENYKKLIELAEKLDTPHSNENIKNLNYLLSEINITVIKPEHSMMIDDLISILHNTNNICEEYHSNIIELQDNIRKLNV